MPSKRSLHVHQNLHNKTGSQYCLDKQLFIIHSNCLFVLSSIRDRQLNSLSHTKKMICWIPSHIRIQGNHEADSVAKSVHDTRWKLQNTIHWLKTENQPSTDKEITTLRGQKYPLQALPNTTHFKRKKTRSS